MATVSAEAFGTPLLTVVRVRSAEARQESEKVVVTVYGAV